MFLSRAWNIVGGIACAAALAACTGGSKDKLATQVAAKVNSDEISVHEINAVLSRTPNLPADQVKQASRAVLERLIDQELLDQQAVDKEFDRKPTVLQAIEAARREILARAYLDSIVVDVSKPSRDEVKAFYGAHPELFARRRIYDLRMLDVRLPTDRQDAFDRVTKEARTIDDLAAWLHDQDIPFAATEGAKPAEQLPLEALPRFAQMKDGDIGVMHTPAGVMVVHLIGSRLQPMHDDAAAPLIEKYLSAKKRGEIAKREIQRLRHAAKIEYKGEFADAQTAGIAGKAAADTPAASPAVTTAPTDKGAAASLDRISLEKGAAGLN